MKGQDLCQYRSELLTYKACRVLRTLHTTISALFFRGDSPKGVLGWILITHSNEMKLTVTRLPKELKILCKNIQMILMNFKYFNILFTQITAWRSIVKAGAQLTA
jgi:hypothetical protein